MTHTIIPVNENETQIFDGATGKMSTSRTGDGKLVLYMEASSYYSQKVVLTMEEKRIPFTKKNVSILSQENYKDWYLDINPRGEVPTLQDGKKIIGDSGKIIEYIEQHYSEDPYVRLSTADLGEDITKKVEEVRAKIDAFDGNIIAYGTLFHSNHVQDIKFPFNISSVRKDLKELVETMPSRMRKLAETHPKIKEVLEVKAARGERVLELVSNKDSFQLELNKVASFLEEMEKLLMFRTPEMEDWWLCCERYTQADVSLTVLLTRISLCGLEEWTFASLPHLQEYFRRVKERPSYDKTFPTLFRFIVENIAEKKLILLGVSVIVAVSVTLICLL